jgi:hypothetical protein
MPTSLPGWLHPFREKLAARIMIRVKDRLILASLRAILKLNMHRGCIRSAMASDGLRFANQQAAHLPDYVQQKVYVIPTQTVIDTARPKRPLALDCGSGQKHTPVFLQRVQQPAAQVIEIPLVLSP